MMCARLDHVQRTLGRLFEVVKGVRRLLDAEDYALFDPDSDLTVVLVATQSVVTPESYVVFRRPHFLGAAVRARRQTPEIEETGMLSRQAAVESRRRPGTEADPSTVAVGRALLNSEAITEAIRAIRRARSAHGTGTRSRRMQTINPAHNRI